MVKTIITVLAMMAFGLISAGKSQARIVRDNPGQEYFQRTAETLCSPIIQVRVGPHNSLITQTKLDNCELEKGVTGESLL
jgi:hypothetical protein